jgi:hypothetical protein
MTLADQSYKAIAWAVRNGADIISLSLGFPTPDPDIKKAIEKANDSVIFLASCGNDSNSEENFPARHPSVISIYSTDRHGDFSKANARKRNPFSDQKSFGTYGEEIPDAIFGRIRSRFPGVCSPGSSVATAVAAAIGATMLCYVDHLPDLRGPGGRNEEKDMLKIARRKPGMEALFGVMADDMKSDGGLFINPVWFWTHYNTPQSRDRSISTCLHDACAYRGR